MRLAGAGACERGERDKIIKLVLVALDRTLTGCRRRDVGI
jgi:hypothetical protein